MSIYILTCIFAGLFLFLLGMLIGVLLGQFSVWNFLHRKFNVPWTELIYDKLTLKKEN